MNYSAAIAKEHIKAAKKAMKKSLQSKEAAKASLVRAGILAKGGKKLAKPYR